MARTTIGIDVGSTSVRAVQVRRRGNTIKVVKVAEVPLERGTVVAGEVRNPAALTDAVRQLWKEGRFSSKVVTVGLSGPQTLVRQIDLPWEPDEIFRDSLPLRVASDLPINPREMTLDFHPLEIRRRGTALIQRALIVAAVNVVAENTADALTAARLKLRRADFAPFALIRTAVLTAGDGSPVPAPPEGDEERPCEVVIDIGGQTTVIAVHDKGRPLFVRIVAGGSESVTNALADNLHVDVDVADALKQSIGIGMVSADPATQFLLREVTPAKQAGAQQIVNMMAGSLVQVVRESVEYFLSVSPSVSGIERVLLSGGGSLLPGFAERLASELRAPVALLNPMAALATGPASRVPNMDPRMNVALGLALEAE